MEEKFLLMNETKTENKRTNTNNSKKQKNSAAKRAVQNVVSGANNQKQSKSSNSKTAKNTKTTNNSSKNRTTNQKQYNSAPKKRNTKSKTTTSKPVKIIPLGGLGEIGKNITLYEYDGDMILVDCGMTFPDEETPGIDTVIPDFTYVLENKDKIKGLVVTHGHEDHIGAIPYLLKNFNVPIYATRLTIGLIAGKLKEHNC